jgi:phage terminase small subunit
MKITQDLIKKIEMLEKKNFSADEIERFLELTLSVAEVKEEFKKEQDYFTVSEAADRLKSILGKLKDEKAYELKVYRLIDKGEILAEKGSNKIGYRIHKDEVERFITESKMTKEDWKQRALVAEARIKELEKQMESPKVVEETVSEVPEGQTTLDDFSGVSKVGEESENQNLGHSTASDIAENVKITHLKVVKRVTDGLFDLDFKFGDETFAGRVEKRDNRDDVFLMSMESINSSTKYTRPNDEQLLNAIEKALLEKNVLDKIAKKR